jgi:hypothetical protein
LHREKGLQGFRFWVLRIDYIRERERERERILGLGFLCLCFRKRLGCTEREREREGEESDFLRCNSLSATLSQLGDLRCE